MMAHVTSRKRATPPGTPPPVVAEAPLVQVLGGNCVTAMTVWGCLTTRDVTPLRRLHPAIAVAVAGVPWHDNDDTRTHVRDVVRWRTALPAATAIALDARPTPEAAMAALAGVQEMNFVGSGSLDATDTKVAAFPRTLRSLRLRNASNVTAAVRFSHLAALEVLDCSNTQAVANGADGLPSSLRELIMVQCPFPPAIDFRHLSDLRRLEIGRTETTLSAATVAGLPPSLEELDIRYGMYGTGQFIGSLVHLPHLRTLVAPGRAVDDATLSALPPGLIKLDVSGCLRFTPAASFAHLRRLHTLVVCHSNISIPSLATLPPSLAVLNMSTCSLFRGKGALLVPALPPALRVLDVSCTDIGDAAVASMPSSLVELRMDNCYMVTPGANIRHLTALRVLHCSNTNLSRSAIAAHRVRGCSVVADGMLVGHTAEVQALACLPDGRLISGDADGSVLAWDLGSGTSDLLRDAYDFDQLTHDSTGTLASTLLSDGRTLAFGLRGWGRDDAPQGTVWFLPTVLDDDDTAWARTGNLQCDVTAMAVLLDGRLAIGCGDGYVLLVDGSTYEVGAEFAVVEGATYEDTECDSVEVAALVALPSGMLATAAELESTVKVWDPTTLACVATLTVDVDGKSGALAVLPGGRLAIWSLRGVQLWDLAHYTCVAVLWHGCPVDAMAVLPDGRLATAAGGNSLRVWNTHAAKPEAVITLQVSAHVCALVALPGGRLASTTVRGRCVQLWQLPLPSLF